VGELNYENPRIKNQTNLM